MDRIRALLAETLRAASSHPPDGGRVMDVLLARAGADCHATTGRDAKSRHVPSIAFVLAGVRRLSDDGRLAVLSHIAGGAHDGATPWDAENLRTIFRALLRHPPAMTPQVATEFFRIYAKDEITVLFGLRVVLKRMEAGDPNRFASHTPLIKAYRDLRKRHIRLNANVVVSAEIEARIQRLLGIEAYRTSEGDSLKALILERPSGSDGLHVDAYLHELETHLGELDAWRTTIEAMRPDYHREVMETWARRYGSHPPGQLRATVFAPVTCYADLDPPPPSWLMEAFRRKQAKDAGFPVASSVSDGATSFQHHTMLKLRAPCFSIFNRVWLVRARNAKRLADLGRPRHDWSKNQIVLRPLLDLEGGAPDALFELVWQARGARPTARWLDEARGLLDTPSGPGATSRVRDWLAEIAEPIAIPEPRVEQLAVSFEALCAHAKEAVTVWGARRAAIEEICKGGTFGYYEDGHGYRGLAQHPSVLSEANDIVARGCAWFLSLTPGPEATACLERTALACLTKAPSDSGGRIHRSLAGVNASIWSLGRIGSPDAIEALSRLRGKAKEKRIVAAIDKAVGGGPAATDAGSATD